MLKTIFIDDLRITQGKKYGSVFMDYMFDSIRSVGIRMPILVQETKNGYNVIDGKARVIVAKQLGINWLSARVIGGNDALRSA